MELSCVGWVFIFVTGGNVGSPPPLTTNTKSISIVCYPRQGTTKSKVRRWMYNQWKQEWLREPDCGQTKFWFSGPDPLFSRRVLKYNRTNLALLIQFITGHCWLSRHDSIVQGGSTTDIVSCPQCDTNLTNVNLQGLEQLSGEDHRKTLRYLTSDTPIHMLAVCPATQSKVFDSFLAFKRKACPQGPSFHNYRVDGPLKNRPFLTLDPIALLAFINGLESEGFRGRTNNI